MLPFLCGKARPPQKHDLALRQPEKELLFSNTITRSSVTWYKDRLPIRYILMDC